MSTVVVTGSVQGTFYSTDFKVKNGIIVRTQVTSNTVVANTASLSQLNVGNINVTGGIVGGILYPSGPIIFNNSSPSYIYNSNTGGLIFDNSIRTYQDTSNTSIKYTRIGSLQSHPDGTSPEITLDIFGTDAVRIPVGNTAQQPASSDTGMLRFNTDTSTFEGHNGTAWGAIGGGVDSSNTAPSNPNAGDLWFNTDDGSLAVYYDDGDTSQWVVASGAAGSNGTDGTGFTGGSYNPSTGVVTFTSDDGLGFSTGDLRGPTYPSANTTTTGLVDTTTQSFAGNKTFANNVSVDTLKLALKDPGPAHQEGLIYYNDEYKALTVYTDVSDVSLQVGLEEWIRVYNSTGSTILNGTPVYKTGAFGETPTVAPADATTEAKARVIGIATHDITNNTAGFVTVRGLVSGINTSHLTAGQPIHLAANGTIQNLAPTYPYYPVDLGSCIVSDATNGYIYVNVENHTYEQFRVTGNQHIDGSLQIDGDLVVTGTQSVVSQASLAIDDSFVYLNSGDTIGLNNTTFTGTGLNDAYFNNHYEGTTTKTFYVRIDGVGTGTGGVDTFEWSLDNFSTTEATGVDLQEEVLLSDNICIHFNANVGHTLGDTWSGTAAPLNVDSGWFSNRNTGTSGVGYTHMGIFFDVSDNKFKVVDVYDPEPQGDINTGDASFSLGTLVAGTFEGNLTGNVTGNLTGNAETATNSVSLNGQAAPYYLNYNNFTNVPTNVSTFTNDAGYLTSYTETDTLDSVTDRGATTTNEITVGGLSFDGTVKLDANGLTTLSTSQTTLTQFATATYTGGKFIISAKQGTAIHMTELMVVHDGTTASAVEYGTVMTGSSLFSIDVDISGGFFRLRITPTSATSTQFNVSETLFLV